MMDKQDSREPDLIRDLIKAGVGGEARPNASQRTEMIARLKTEIQLTRVPSEFPAAVLLALLVILILLAIWLAGTNSTVMETVRLVLYLCIGLNVLCIPISSVVIIRRRQNETKN